MENTPAQTSHKAVWTAIASAFVSVVMMLAGVIPVNVDAFSSDLTEAVTLVAAVAAQAAVAGGTAYFKRNYLK